MTRKTFGEKMNEESEKYKAMSKKEKEEYLNENFPGLFQQLEEMKPDIKLAYQTIKEVKPVIQNLIEILPFLPKTSQFVTQTELEDFVDPATEIGIEQIDKMNEQIEIMEKQTKKANISLILAIIAISISTCFALLTLILR